MARAAVSLVFAFAFVFSHLENMFFAALIGEESLNRLTLNTFLKMEHFQGYSKYESIMGITFRASS